MAKITKIKMENLKGLTVEQPLTGKDIFIGPNGVGKTARMKALALAVMGYDPKLGKRPMDTMRLASADRMSVSLETDSDFGLTRTLANGAKISHAIQLSPSFGEKGLNKCEARVTQELGDFAVMWNLGEFLDLSDDKRRDFIFSLSKVEDEGWDKPRVLEAIAQNSPIGQGDDEAALFNVWIQQTFVCWKESQSVQSALSNMLAFLKDQMSHWSKKKRDGQAAEKRLTELKNEYGEETSEAIGDTKKVIAGIHEDLAKIREQIARDEEKIKQSKLHGKRIQELTENIKKLKGQVTAAEQERSLDDWKADLERADKALLDWEEALQREVKEDQKVQVQRMAAGSLIIKLAEHVLQNTCPIMESIKCEQDFADILHNARQDADRLTSTLEAKKKTVGIAEEQVRISKQRIAEVQAKIKQHELTQSKRDSIKLYEKQLQDLQKEELGTEGMADPEILKATRQGLETSLAEKKKELEHKQKIKETMVLVNELAYGKLEAEQNLEAIKILKNLLGPKGVQGEIVRTIMEPLTHIISTLLSKIDPKMVFDVRLVNEKEQEVFQMGWQKNGRFVPFDSLSAGQEVIFSAAIITALILKRNPACKILCVELGECDAHNSNLLLAGLDVFSEHLDNILVCSWHKVKAPEGWKTWEL